MSFLAEILVTKGIAEVEELNMKIQEINKCVVSLKEEVTVMIEDKYINFTYSLDDTSRMMNKVRVLAGQIDNSQERIDCQIQQEIAGSADELDVLSKSLQEVNLSLRLVNRLLEINLTLDAARDMKNNSKFLNIAEQLRIVEEDLKSNNSGLQHLEIFEALKAELIFQQQKHSYNIMKLWSQCLVWSETVIENNCRTVTLKLATHLDKEELFKALYFYSILSQEIREFADKLFKDVLCSIISQVTRVDFEGSSTISLKVDLRGNSKPLCIDVLNNLTIVFNFISLELNLKAEEVSFICELKDHIGEEFCHYLIKNCLSQTVPKKREELEEYKSLMEEITAFEVLLKEIGFLAEDDKSIAEYATNVEELFATKTCEGYLSAARNIMKKDLHDIKQVGIIEGNEPEELESTVTLSEVSPYTFQFPACQISKSTDELLDLVSEMLREVPHNTDMCAVRLFYAARNVFTMYCDVVPEYHSRLLDTIPQQSAILQNNAMYLAHQLMLLGPRHRHTMPPVLQAHTVTFVDLVDTLRTLGNNVFTRQLQMQKKHIVDILRDSGLVTLSDSPKFPEGVEKAIRQCLRQLALLQTVWQRILPVNTYCKALGMLGNTFVEEIIHKVIAAEDIPSDTAAQLVVVFNLIKQKAPQVFPDPQEVHRHVKKWGKFCELQLLLSAGLREVDDRWADGKGPLAQEFTAEQVRHLVRALFQISDRRATLLAKIV